MGRCQTTLRRCTGGWRRRERRCPRYAETSSPTPTGTTTTGADTSPPGRSTSGWTGPWSPRSGGRVLLGRGAAAPSAGQTHWFSPASLLRATEIFYTLTLADMRRFRGDGRLVEGFPAREHYQRLTEGRRSLGLFQHHDAVTGTARDPVVIDYGTR